MPLFDRLYNFARWLTQNREEAEDLVQETYARALKGFSSFQLGTNFRAWMYRILRNTFLSFRGKKPLQNLPQSTIVLDDQNPLHCGWSQFGHWSVQSCCQGSGSNELFLFLQNRRSIHPSSTQRAGPSPQGSPKSGQ